MYPHQHCNSRYTPPSMLDLQNEVCNGPGACIFRGILNKPGDFAYASGAINNPAAGGIFRVAQVGICVVGNGIGTLHWQFSPPAPITRDTEIVDENGNLVQNHCSLHRLI